MTTQQAINTVVAIAEAECGYLEKKNNLCLYDKTANAGTNNYTKYWADTAPGYQGQAWCADFVTWCIEKAFGHDLAKSLLGHYPYISCIVGKSMAISQNRWTSSPEVGDVIIFGKSNGTPCHTGFVRSFDSKYVYTIEGNTSGGSTVIANGGGVCKKSYARSYGRILGYWHINYSYAAKIITEKEGDLTMNQYEELKKEIEQLKSKLAERTGYYNYIDNNMPASYQPTIKKLVNKGVLKGNEKGELMLTTDLMRTLTILDRLGIL